MKKFFLGLAAFCTLFLIGCDVQIKEQEKKTINIRDISDEMWGDVVTGIVVYSNESRKNYDVFPSDDGFGKLRLYETESAFYVREYAENDSLSDELLHFFPKSHFHFQLENFQKK